MGRRDYRRVRESAKVAQKIERDNRLKQEKEKSADICSRYVAR
jgi:hypothetical protein